MSLKLKVISIYDRIEAADERCIEIVQELRNTCSPGETRSLNQEYLWTVNVVIRLCNELLESEPDDYMEEEDFRINLARFQERYEHILEELNNSNDTV